MTSRLELNWKLDGFVDEQRYYCSETLFDKDSLPAQKAVLLNTDRSYADYDIDEDKTYYVAIESVKNGVGKLSEVRKAFAFEIVPFDNVVSLLNFENDLVDATGKRVWTSTNASTVKAVDTTLLWGDKSLSIIGTALGNCIYTPNSPDFWLESGDFGIEASIYLLSKDNFHTILSQRDDFQINESFCFYFFNNNLVFEYSENGISTTVVSTPFSLNVNQKYDVQAVRKAESLKIAVDGVVLIDHNIGTKSLFNSTARVVVGQLNSTLNGGYLNGYIDEIRVTKGYAPPIKLKKSAFQTS